MVVPALATESAFWTVAKGAANVPGFASDPVVAT
jgi:hypothetical protein